MSVTTRQGLIDYCLRALGSPMVDINITEDMIQDRVDEALEYFRLYHYDGIEKVYLKHKVTSSYLTITTSNSDQFLNNETIIGQTSQAIATVVILKESDANKIYVKNINGTFLPNEIVTTTSGFATLAATDPVTMGDIDNRYIPVDDWIYGVTRVLPFSSGAMSSSMFSLQYQMRMYDLYDLSSTSIIYYKQMMSHLSMLDMELNGKPTFRFNRLNNRLYLDINWEAILVAGEYIVVECYRAMNPAECGRVYGELWLKHYTTALLKKQWGQNLAKFGGMQLPGGITIDGQSIYAQGLKEQKDLEVDIMEKQSPLSFFMG